MVIPFASAERNRNTASLVSAIGIISGTSMDAVDVAMIATDGREVIRRGPSHARPYTSKERAIVAAALADGLAARVHTERTPALRAAEEVVTHAHCEALAAFLDRHGRDAEVIGWHGQTVAHAPERGFTMQLGDPAVMAERFGIPVVYDLRQADMAAGGQGAPLVPVYHRALVRAARLAEPVLVINLGGVANVTYIEGETLLAFDTGPASAMVDDAMAEVGARYDEDGRTAAIGTVDEAALAELLADPYFDAPPPKSLDRNAFRAAPVAHLALADKVATLTRFSAEALGRALAHCPARPRTLIAAGGGVHNRTLIGAIETALAAPVTMADAVGFSADFLEAEAFAYLAVRSRLGLPITYPGTTGVAVPTGGGVTAVPPPRQRALS